SGSGGTGSAGTGSGVGGVALLGGLWRTEATGTACVRSRQGATARQSRTNTTGGKRAAVRCLGGMAAVLTVVGLLQRLRDQVSIRGRANGAQMDPIRPQPL